MIWFTHVSTSSFNRSNLLKYKCKLVHKPVEQNYVFLHYCGRKPQGSVTCAIKGIVHPKMKMMSLITHPHVIPNPKDLCSSSEHKLRYFEISYSREHTAKTDMEEKKLLNKVVVLVFFAHKKYSRSFIKLRLNHWCHMDYFNDVLATFLDLESGSSIAVYGGSESSRISSKIS